MKVQLKWTSEPHDLNTRVSQPVHIACEADGQPSPKIEWFKLKANRRDPFGRILNFHSVSQEDAGQYECVASNGQEDDLVSRVKLDVLGE